MAVKVEQVPKRLADHRAVEFGVAVKDDAPPPPPPRGLLAETRRWWEEAWGDPLAAAWEVSDRQVVRRLARYYDERERIDRAVKADGFLMGSTGGDRRHPLLGHRLELDKEIRQLEDRLGLSPMSRLRLGITYADAQHALSSLNEEVLDGWD